MKNNFRLLVFALLLLPLPFIVLTASAKAMPKDPRAADKPDMMWHELKKTIDDILNDIPTETLSQVLTFNSSENLLGGEWVEVEGGVAPTDFEMRNLRAGLWAFASEHYKGKFEDRKKYTYQYQKTLNDEIRIQAACAYSGYGTDAAGQRRTLKKGFLVIMDGGSCYFDVIYNTKSRKFNDLFVSGFA
jgi:hypothetical protein